MVNDMTICKLCLEEYEEENVRCPYCGCPADWLGGNKFSDYSDTGDRYRLLQIYDRDDPFPDGLYWDGGLQQKVQIRKLPLTRSGVDCAEFIRALDSEEDWHPRLHELKEPDGRLGYYICGAEEGKTLRRLLEGENPLEADKATRIEAGIWELLRKVEGTDLPVGIFLPEHLRITDTAVTLADLGPGNSDKSDRQQAEELVFRIRNGCWPREASVIKQGKLREITEKILGYVRRDDK